MIFLSHHVGIRLILFLNIKPPILLLLLLLLLPPLRYATYL